MIRTATTDDFATHDYNEGGRPLRNATTSKLVAFVGAGLVFCLVCPRLMLRGQDPSTFACATAASGEGAENDGAENDGAGSLWCKTNAFDVAVTNAVVVAPMVTSTLSHAFTFVASPAVGIWSVIRLRGPGTVLSDLAIYLGTQFVSAGLNGMAKNFFRRQRPCYHFGRRNETEAAFLPPREEFRSFYSGDAAMAFSLYAAAPAVVVARGRRHTHMTTKLSGVGGVVASIGSVLRVVGFMHWCTDVLVGAVLGFSVGFGLPTLLFSTEPARDAFARGFPLRASASSFGRSEAGPFVMMAAVPTEERDGDARPAHGADGNEEAIEDEEEDAVVETV